METFKERTRDLDEIIKKLGKSSKSSKSDNSFDQVTFEFEFFNGGRNTKFDYFTKKIGVTNENLEFVDFLQSDYCKEIMQSNDLKIHIETGNIYYNDTDTNESIFDFMKNQQNNSKGVINYDLKFDGSYKNYFKWILNEYEAPEKTKYDLFAFQNTKYLVYIFNNSQNPIGRPLIKIRHSVVTDNYLAAEEIQNENWQYFIQRTIEVCKSKVLIRPHEEFLLSTVENVTIAKKAYETFYNIIEKNLYLTKKKFSVDEKEKIQENFQNKYFAGEDSLTNLDSWIEFYYHFGRFPGSDHFTNAPDAEMPHFLKTTIPLSPMKLHTSFRRTDAKGLA